jgi:hypothetical protein
MILPSDPAQLRGLGWRASLIWEKGAYALRLLFRTDASIS